MQEYILKKTKAGKTAKNILIVAVMLGIVLLIVGGFAGINDLMIVGLLVFMIGCAGVAVYFELFRPFFSSVKSIERYYDDSVYNGIDPNNLSFPKSGICCGEKAFLSKTAKVIIPYSSVIWVYLKNTKALGVTVNKEVIINCRDGKSFSIKADTDELNVLLALIRNHSQDLMLGYDFQQERKAYEISKQFKALHKRKP